MSSDGLSLKEGGYSDVINSSIDSWLDGSAELEEEFDSSISRYKKYIFRKWIFIAVCVTVALVVMGVALTIGEYPIGFWESYEVVWNHLTGNVTDVTKDYIIWNLRMPRIFTGIIAGAGLAVAGATMQSILKNPLADPYTTGISSGAGFGATLAICAGTSLAGGEYTIVLNAFVFSLIPATIIMFVSKIKNASPTVMVMSGIAVMYIFNAMTTVLKLWSDPDALAALYKWSVGTLADASWDQIWMMAAVTVAGIVAIQLLSRQLNVLATGDESAKALGVNADRLRVLCLAVISLVAAAIVSFTGLIGFVGIVCPHVVRLFIGSDNRYLVPASMVFGVALILAADLIGRTIIAPSVLQVGVITAFLGGPMFLYLIIRQKKSVW